MNSSQAYRSQKKVNAHKVNRDEEIGEDIDSVTMSTVTSVDEEIRLSRYIL